MTRRLKMVCLGSKSTRWGSAKDLPLGEHLWVHLSQLIRKWCTGRKCECEGSSSFNVFLSLKHVQDAVQDWIQLWNHKKTPLSVILSTLSTNVCSVHYSGRKNSKICWPSLRLFLTCGHWGGLRGTHLPYDDQIYWRLQVSCWVCSQLTGSGRDKQVMLAVQNNTDSCLSRGKRLTFKKQKEQTEAPLLL